MTDSGDSGDSVELETRLRELAGKAGVDLNASQPATSQPPTSHARKAPSRRYEAGTGEVFGGWPVVRGIIDPRAFCNPPRGANLALLPHHGGSIAIAGGMAWEIWCLSVCGCEAHVRQRKIALATTREMVRRDRRTSIVEEEVTGE